MDKMHKVLCFVAGLLVGAIATGGILYAAGMLRPHGASMMYGRSGSGRMMRGDGQGGPGMGMMRGQGGQGMMGGSGMMRGSGSNARMMSGATMSGAMAPQVSGALDVSQ